MKVLIDKSLITCVIGLMLTVSACTPRTEEAPAANSVASSSSEASSGSESEGSVPGTSPGATEGAEAPSSTRPDLVTTAQLQTMIAERNERPLVVHFWASWCGPCVKEWPTLQKLAATWAGKADFVMVSVDDAVDNPQMLRLLREHPARSDSRWWDDDDMDGLLKTFGAGWQGSLPATFVFDAAGEPRRAWLEPIPSSKLEGLLESLSTSVVVPAANRRLATTRFPTGQSRHRRCGPPTKSKLSPPPTITAKSLQDRIARLRDEVLVVHVWASWCSVCQSEWPEIESFVESVRGCGTQVVGIATDDDGDALAQWLDGAKPRFANLWLATDRASLYQLLKEDWEGEIPATFVFDASGKQVFSHVGLLDAASLLEVVDQHQGLCSEGAEATP